MKNATMLLRLAERRQRSQEIITVLAKYGFADNLTRDLNASLEKVLRGRLRVPDPEVASMTAAERLRAALTELGTAWIKLGQLLSLRPDVVGQSIAAELGQLESAASSDAPAVATDTVKTELGAPPEELFRTFETTAFASASVAQVHAATLHDGTDVVVKVVHRGADTRAKEDVEIMMALAQLWEHNDPVAKQYRPVQIANELATMIHDALDMRAELTNLENFGRRLAHHEDIYIPEPVPHLSSQRVLTMTRVRGQPLRELKNVTGAGWELEDLTQMVVAVYFEMIFSHGAFHADPHPGNLILLPDGRLAIIDFGDVGRLTAARREQLERIVLAMALRDAEEFARILIEICNPQISHDTEQLRMDLGSWFERYVDVGVGDLEVGVLIRSAMSLLHRHGLTLPGDFTLLIRVLIQLQGLSTTVGVDLSPGELLAPHVRQVIRSRIDPRRLARELASSGLRWRQFAGALPDDLSAMIKAVRQGTVTVNFNVHDPEHLTDDVIDGMIGAAALLSSAQLIAQDAPPKLGSISIPGAVALGIGAATWARMANRRRNQFSLLSGAQNLARLRHQVGRKPR